MLATHIYMRKTYPPAMKKFSPVIRLAAKEISPVMKFLFLSDQKFWVFVFERSRYVFSTFPVMFFGWLPLYFACSRYVFCSLCFRL